MPAYLSKVARCRLGALVDQCCNLNHCPVSALFAHCSMAIKTFELRNEARGWTSKPHQKLRAHHSEGSIMTITMPTEEEVASWDMDALLSYGRDGLSNHSSDPEELIRRRTVLITSKFGDVSPVLREVVMLSLVARDMETVRKVVDWLEEAGDPAMGYYAWKAMSDRGEADLGEEFLTSAARHGHFPAQRVLSDRKARERGVFGIFFLALSRLAHAWRVYRVVRENPKDLRLR